ncbi:DUF542 domain-containing protein [Oceaniovalibus sp. ACAM 378]|uniref:DUF542 domain-containing protein n=1 Tax=Oceaniovalibus sp. ACAM 378 TaxID=2599923 RepID=UPI0011D44681|nr:DUF542 domain-containing protein [Oceaniovalibus sp. ACAM 378]TYB87931.1 iron-sulfur cluster repair di-iron protein [Oceaniovalibus sp. ACAM 378]
MAQSVDTLHNQNVGDIAAHLPGASGVFREFGIDYCCQGHVTLIDAAARRNLDLGVIDTTLGALDPAATPSAPRETTALIDHIQTRYHAVHRRQIPDLIDLSHRVETAHVNHPQVPAGLAETLTRFMGEMEVHMKKEELILFPAMRQKAMDRLGNPLRELRHDHNDHAFFLDQIARLTEDLCAPTDACASWQALYSEAGRSKADLMEHIHLENNVLFPRYEMAMQD